MDIIEDKPIKIKMPMSADKKKLIAVIVIVIAVFGLLGILIYQSFEISNISKKCNEYYKPYIDKCYNKNIIEPVIDLSFNGTI